MVNQILIKLLLILSITLMLNTILPAESIKVIAPYFGTIENVTKDDMFELKDTADIYGIYGLITDPDLFQANFFLYTTEDINYSDLIGGHFMVDYYPMKNDWGKVAVGYGFEAISLETNAENNIPPLSNFEMENNVYVSFLRTGEYFEYSIEDFNFSLFPWIGVQAEDVEVEGSFNLPNNMQSSFNSNQHDIYSIYGINLNNNWAHIIELNLKYSVANYKAVHHDNITIMTNLNFSRNWGISLRYKYMETSTGSNEYYMGGIAYSF
ncbi:MAG: hypothetical protein ACD_79C00611G0002, partial [uncultured bacterium]